MEVILLETFDRLGQIGDIVKVKNGFARNFLIPQKKALRANNENKEKFLKIKNDLIKKSDEIIEESKVVLKKIENKGVPIWLIPTNAGTGSEASFNASFVDTNSNRKMGINGNHMFAEKSFLDAETTLSCPKLPLMGAAIDAIVHSVEGYICKNSNTVLFTCCNDIILRFFLL